MKSKQKFVNVSYVNKTTSRGKKVRLNTNQLKIMVIVVGVVAIFSVGLLIGTQFFTNESNGNGQEGEDPINDDNLILVKPSLSDSFLNDEAGIILYFEAGQTLDLNQGKSAFNTIEVETVDYIIGSLSIPNQPETEDVHCFVHINGWIVCYYLKNESVSKIIDWNFYDNGTLYKTKLYEGLEIMADKFGITISGANYFHYQYQEATKFMIIIEDQETCGIGSFNLILPAEFTFYERSWSHNYGNADSWFIDEFGYLNATQLLPEVTHTFETEVYCGGVGVWDRVYFRLDGEEINFYTMGGTMRFSNIGLTLLYKES